MPSYLRSDFSKSPQEIYYSQSMRIFYFLNFNFLQGKKLDPIRLGWIENSTCFTDGRKFDTDFHLIHRHLKKTYFDQRYENLTYLVMTYDENYFSIDHNLGELINHIKIIFDEHVKFLDLERIF